MHEQMQGEDKVLKCVDCGSEFVFTARDQAFYQERGYSAPRRCRVCRDKRKSGQTPTLGAAPSPGYAPGKPAASRPADEQTAPAAPAGQQFKVTCSSCGTETTVPFKPDPNRPVYCRTCYLQRRKTGA